MKLINHIAIILCCILTIACNSAQRKDEELAAEAQRSLVASTVINGSAMVKDGVATLSGQCADEYCRTEAGTRISRIEGISRVVNKITVNPATERP